jgi:hypothetical protein
VTLTLTLTGEVRRKGRGGPSRICSWPDSRRGGSRRGHAATREPARARARRRGGAQREPPWRRRSRRGGQGRPAAAAPPCLGRATRGPSAPLRRAASWTGPCSTAPPRARGWRSTGARRAASPGRRGRPAVVAPPFARRRCHGRRSGPCARRCGRHSGPWRAELERRGGEGARAPRSEEGRGGRGTARPPGSDPPEAPARLTGRRRCVQGQLLALAAPCLGELGTDRRRARRPFSPRRPSRREWREQGPASSPRPSPWPLRLRLAMAAPTQGDEGGRGAARVQPERREARRRSSSRPAVEPPPRAGVGARGGELEPVLRAGRERERRGREGAKGGKEKKKTDTWVLSIDSWYRVGT